MTGENREYFVFEDFNVSQGRDEGNIEKRGKQNKLVPQDTNH